MKIKKNNEFKFIFFVIVVIHRVYSNEMISYSNPNYCKKDEYFNIHIMQCEQCDPNKNLIPSSDKLSCVCNQRSKILPIPEQTIMATPLCEPCKKNTIPSNDGKSCSLCTKIFLSSDNSTLICKQCKNDEILREKINGTQKIFECVRCQSGMIPDKTKSQCISCIIINPVTENKNVKSCNCPQKNTLFGDICVPTTLLPEWPDEKSSYLIDFDSGIKIESEILKKYLRASVYACKLKNITACEIVGNLCTLLLYRDYSSSPCRLWESRRYLTTSSLPWLMYGEGDAYTVLNRRKISTQFTLSPELTTSWLNITATVLSFDGKYKGIKKLTGQSISLCPASWEFLENGFRFGIDYQYSCNVYVSYLTNNFETEILSPYLQYMDIKESQLYAIPILIRNIKSHSNRDGDMGNWLLVRRFFLLDKILTDTNNMKKPYIMRYAKSIELRVRVRNSNDNGRIYPPYLVITYGEISQYQIKSNAKVPFRISVKYEMSNDIGHSIEIAIGVLTSIATLYSGIQTWSHSRRSGRMTIDLGTLIQLCIFACGNLANAFFIVSIGVCIHSFLFYKGQSVVHLLLPDSSVQTTIRNYIIVAFSLKIVEVFYMIFQQVSIDMFLIDWERPRPYESIPRQPVSAETTPSIIHQKVSQQPVSIWRTYFIANEWNEIQTYRKISLVLHLVLVGMFLEIFGLKYWASLDPSLHTSAPDYLKQTPNNIVCRLAVAALVYSVLYILQIFISMGLYERYIKNAINDFIDICSMANISIFILKHKLFGYYIHGRSVHGFADTDMHSMALQLQRERDNLCGRRGLAPGSDQQTFSVTVPMSLSILYQKLTSKAPLPRSAAESRPTTASTIAKKIGETDTDTIDKFAKAYNDVNKFLAAFIEHAIKDLDYEIRDRLFTESLLDIEFTEYSERGIFYSDGGHSFDKVLFYGNEFTLASFDIIVFCFFELMFGDYILDIIVTLLFYKVLQYLRKYLGQRNLAKKTLIDDRFLI